MKRSQGIMVIEGQIYPNISYLIFLNIWISTLIISQYRYKILYLWIYIYIYIYIYTHTHTHIYVCIHIYIYIHTHTYTYMYTYTYTHSGILLSHTKWYLATSDNMGGPRGYYAKWNKAEREIQMLYDFTYMWNLKNKMNKYNKTATDS